MVVIQAGGLAIPVEGDDPVLFDPQALFVQITKIDCTPCIALLGSLAIPLGSENIVRFGTQTFFENFTCFAVANQTCKAVR